MDKITQNKKEAWGGHCKSDSRRCFELMSTWEKKQADLNLALDEFGSYEEKGLGDKDIYLKGNAPSYTFSWCDIWISQPLMHPYIVFTN